MSKNITGDGDVRFGQDEASLIAFMIKQATGAMATAQLVKVLAVNADTVDVRPLVNQIDGDGTGVPHGKIHALPWFTMRAGACEVRIKPVVGDIGLAVFCHSDTSTAKATKDYSNPGSRRRFDWADGLYFGGFLASSAATTFIDVTPTQIEVKAATIKLTGAVQVAGSLTATGEVTGNGKALSTHTHSGVTAGGGTSGPPV